MKAIVQDAYGSADVLRVENIEKPEIGDGDVLVRVHAAGLDPGVWHLMTGLPYLVRIMGYGLRAPKNRVPGFDFAGRIEAVGGNVTRFREGDEVFGAAEGTFAEYACCKEDLVTAKPANLTFEQAAAVPTSATTALQGLRNQGKVEAGQSVLIIGASGGVGHFAVQIAGALGAEVTGVCSTTKVDMVRSIGADHVVDYKKEDFTEMGRQYDLILDTAGARPVSRLRKALTRRGTLVIVGAEGGNRWTGGIGRPLRGAMLSPFVNHDLKMFFAVANRQDLEYLSELVGDGTIAPVVDRTYPLAEAADGIRYWEHGHGGGKVVITI